jgi:hypothetical protein
MRTYFHLVVSFHFLWVNPTNNVLIPPRQVCQQYFVFVFVIKHNICFTYANYSTVLATSVYTWVTKYLNSAQNESSGHTILTIKKAVLFKSCRMLLVELKCKRKTERRTRSESNVEDRQNWCPLRCKVRKKIQQFSTSYSVQFIL